jgi:hypothetical protein
MTAELNKLQDAYSLKIGELENYHIEIEKMKSLVGPTDHDDWTTVQAMDKDGGARSFSKKGEFALNLNLNYRNQYLKTGSSDFDLMRSENPEIDNLLGCYQSADEQDCLGRPMEQDPGSRVQTVSKYASKYGSNYITVEDFGGSSKETSKKFESLRVGPTRKTKLDSEIQKNLILHDRVQKMERKVGELLPKEESDLYLNQLQAEMNPSEVNWHSDQGQDAPDLANYNSAERVDLKAFNLTQRENNFLKQKIYQ